ncbi:MAG: hypothetical protein QXG00_05550 [Candidatus Woesearchaeota archaeon]
MVIKFLNSKELKVITKILKEQFGYDNEMNYYFFRNTKNKIYIINKEIARLNINNLRIDTFGLYLGEVYNNELRLSIEGSQIIGPLSKKNIVEIPDYQVGSWMKGEDIDYSGKEIKGFVIVKNNKDFFGCGKIQDRKIRNYISKARKLKIVNE